MKLSSASVDQARNQVSAQPIPDDHPVAPQLAQLFGKHTFFLDEEGLLIIEPVDSTRGTSPMGKGDQTGELGRRQPQRARPASAGDD
jgi:hypothetical protein